MKFIFSFLLVFIFTCNFSQVNQFQNSRHVETDQDVYNADKQEHNSVLLIPFDAKMYFSSIDVEIANNTGLSYDEIRKKIRYGLVNQLLLSMDRNISAVSLIHHDTSEIYSDLDLVYSSIGYKYRLLPKEENIDTTNKSKVERLKGKLNKLVHHQNSDNKQESPKKDYQSASIYNGEVRSTKDYSERYMHTSIHNPNLLSDLQNKYETNVYIFINELNIEQTKRHHETQELTKRIKVHYTIFNQQYEEIAAGASIVYMPSSIDHISTIINKYLSQVAIEICSKLPFAKTEEEQEIKHHKIINSYE